MKSIKFLLTIFLLVVSVQVFIQAGCAAKKDTQKSQKKPMAVETETVKSDKIVRSLKLTGAVEPYRSIRLASQAEGPVVNLYFREGDEIGEGKTIIKIGRKAGVTALIASLQEDLKKDQENLERIQKLAEKEAIAGEQVDMAKASFEKAKAALARADEMEKDYNISAPWSGIISKVFVKDGDYVSPRTTLVEIYDPKTLIIRAHVPEKDAAILQKDMEAQIQLDAYQGKSFAGKIVRLYPYLDERMRTRIIEIELQQDIKLLPGMFCRIKLNLETIADALTVPAHSIAITPSGGSIVYLVMDGKAIQRKVITGISDGARVQVLSGLNQGEQIITAGQEKLKDGMQVQVLTSFPKGEIKKQSDKQSADGKPEVVKGSIEK